MWDHGVKGLDVHYVKEALAGVIVVKLKSPKDLKCMVSVLDVYQHIQRKPLLTSPA